ncbi:hypothetical protein [Rhizosaccharibacter radicis]|uniref:SnoaL-like domain-containing protein n=1 Tax=Rhizosaccharibacter radicis TaxID=2782605 RepID=A0ABT1VY17_9PROT|nr:hypothetical protein [Acetobacteraceae bacterium KSS12]
MSSFHAPDGRHGVIVIHSFNSFSEGDFIEDTVLIDRLVEEGQGWRLREAVRLDHDDG